MNADNTVKEKNPGCLRRMMVGLGCGCLYPSIILVIIVAISWYSFAEIYRGITAKFDLNEFSGLKQEDYWSLQEKRIVLLENDKKNIELTPAELNALLSRINLAPYQGFYLHRIRFLPHKNEGVLFLIGSGFFLRSMVFSLDISFENEVEIEQIYLNAWKIPNPGFFHDKIKNWLKNLLSPDKSSLLRAFYQNANDIEVSSNSIILPASIIREQ
ncbi:MAG: hypothetical protein ACQETH_04050 [Candidatus Rifleibacteriota bacterium]